MARQADRERKYDEILFHYLWVFIYDLSGLGNNTYLSHPKYASTASGLGMSKTITNLIRTLDITNQKVKAEF